mmetsp:Transcript_22588/g.50237  ORF Transcript_22588/g.50237 Transcript_22588/m.50237 type:complete len:80 (-) Transcript_22588:162-401(-)
MLAVPPPARCSFKAGSRSSVGDGEKKGSGVSVPLVLLEGDDTAPPSSGVERVACLDKSMLYEFKTVATDHLSKLWQQIT